MAARQVIEAEFVADQDHACWTSLHDELNGLPESFRAPLVLCYLEGLTQEQAAAQLHCPLGTIQSRLARGRAKLKARLTKKGVDFSTALGGIGQFAAQPTAPPLAWADATVRLAMQFTQSKGSAVAAAGAATALANEVLKSMALTKLKMVVGVFLLAAVMVSGAASWIKLEPDTDGRRGAIKAMATNKRPEPDLPQKPAPALPEHVTRTIRGTVRDEQGRPVAKAWIGAEVSRHNDDWTIVEMRDRIRECKEPFRDRQGKIVPAGVLAKYYELRDRTGKWQPVDPADIRQYDLSRADDPFVPIVRDRRAIEIALAKGETVFEIRTKRFPWMNSLELGGQMADRTDQEGRFLIEASILTGWGQRLVFSSSDFSRQAVQDVRYDDPDLPMEITLKPLRLVCVE